MKYKNIHSATKHVAVIGIGYSDDDPTHPSAADRRAARLCAPAHTAPPVGRRLMGNQ